MNRQIDNVSQLQLGDRVSFIETQFINQKQLPDINWYNKKTITVAGINKVKGTNDIILNKGEVDEIKIPELAVKNRDFYLDENHAEAAINALNESQHEKLKKSITELKTNLGILEEADKAFKDLNNVKGY